MPASPAESEASLTPSVQLTAEAAAEAAIAELELGDVGDMDGDEAEESGGQSEPGHEEQEEGLDGAAEYRAMCEEEEGHGAAEGGGEGVAKSDECAEGGANSGGFVSPLASGGVLEQDGPLTPCWNNARGAGNTPATNSKVFSAAYGTRNESPASDENTPTMSINSNEGRRVMNNSISTAGSTPKMATVRREGAALWGGGVVGR